MTNLMKNPAAVLLLVFLIVGIPFAYDGGLSMLSHAPTTLIISIPFALIYLLIFFLLFRFTWIWPGKPYGWLWSAIAWGAIPVFIFVKVAGASLSALTKQLEMGQFSASLAGALPEEIGKFIGVFLIVLAFSKISKPWHVFVVGIFVGVGFILTENIGYAASGALLNPSSDVAGALSMWIMRSKFGFGLHAIFTSIGVWGLAKSLFASEWSTLRRIATTLLWFLIGFGLHFAWNASPGDPAVNLLKMIVTAILGYGLFLILFLRARKQAKQDNKLTLQTS